MRNNVRQSQAKGVRPTPETKKKKKKLISLLQYVYQPLFMMIKYIYSYFGPALISILSVAYNNIEIQAMLCKTVMEFLNFHF